MYTCDCTVGSLEWGITRCLEREDRGERGLGALERGDRGDRGLDGLT